MLELYAHQAGTGDFLQLRFRRPEEEKYHNIIIDSGKRMAPKEKRDKRKLSFEKLMNRLGSSREDTIDAIFITHWDADHIDGFQQGMKNFSEETLQKMGPVYMNSGVAYGHIITEAHAEHSAQQAKEVVEFLKEKKITWIDSLTQEMQKEKMGSENEPFPDSKPAPLLEIGGAKLWIISPGEEQLNKLKKADARVADYAENTEDIRNGFHAAGIITPKSILEELKEDAKEDQTVANGSSTAFLFEYEGKRLAFLGDAYPSVCVKGLKNLGYSEENPCVVDLIKIPHHGSSHNYSKELYQILVSDTYLVSTNGPINSGNLLPNKSCLAKLLIEAKHRTTGGCGDAENSDLRCDNQQPGSEQSGNYQSGNHQSGNYQSGGSKTCVTLYCNYSWWTNPQHEEYYFKKDTDELQRTISEDGAEMKLTLVYKANEQDQGEEYEQKPGKKYEMELIDINRYQKIKEKSSAFKVERGEKIMNNIVFDFDGVINSYKSGWVSEDIIPDPPVEGIREAIADIRKAGYRVVIVSSRCAYETGKAAIQNWLDQYGIVVDDITMEKPAAKVYIDDRGLRFDGHPESLLEQIEKFEPWWKKKGN